jgi:toxin secretion/phage lysis holin
MNSNDILNFKKTLAGFIAMLTALWGWFGWLVVAWVLLMISDWLVGSAAAMKAGKWSSAKLREGAWHKGGMVIIVCVALVADWLIGSLLGHIPGVTLPFDYTVLLGPMMIVWYILGELGSLAEHAVSMGAKIPAWLPRILAISKDAVDAAGDAITHDGHHDAKGADHEAH